MSKPDYDTTLARIAGNIAAGFSGNASVLGATEHQRERIVDTAFEMAVAIVERCRSKRLADEASR